MDHVLLDAAAGKVLAGKADTLTDAERAALTDHVSGLCTTVTRQASACTFCGMLYGHQERCPMVPAHAPYRTEAP